jgi:hypothetical protein
MITPDQLAVETTDPISETQETNLLLLVRQFGPYIKYTGRWPQLEEKLAEERATPTERTRALRAILTALNDLPPIDAESQGSEGSPGFFSVKRNWDILAQDVLNTFYRHSAWVGPETVGVVKRRINSAQMEDRYYVDGYDTGKIY